MIYISLQPNLEESHESYSKSISQEFLRTDLPEFKAGDRVTVHYKIKEGNKERIQQFQGDVIQRRNSGIDETFTVRKCQTGWV